ncbi:colicin E3-like toxin immunity protein [Pseudomonas rhodesiae]|uniref:colicin E3-like toxin immunity protein n=1 Tax=unclassified Pseudomonas TaxID=196821 RepID=UPI00273513CD|nr:MULTISPECIES: colicin E3-like toxin immunity protein [unclassified Pseudomonas]WLH39829.1 colicin E3-like toxin immunity protein [Pseudomonas sp. FP2254]
MSLRVMLEWFEKPTGFGVGEEPSTIFEDAHSILSSLELEKDYQIFDGAYDLKKKWIAVLQPHFKHEVKQDNYDYQISFHHQGPWPY